MQNDPEANQKIHFVGKFVGSFSDKCSQCYRIIKDQRVFILR